MAVCRFGCNRQFQTEDAMKAHRLAFHSNASNATSASNAVLNGMIKCRNAGCEKAFKNEAAREAHRIDVHIKGSAVSNGKLRCGYGDCKRLFNDSNALGWHKREVHTAPPPPKVAASCSDCHRDFSSVDALRQHQFRSADHFQLSTTIGSLACSECRRSLRTNDCLEQHFVEEHLLKYLPKGNARAQQESDFLRNWRKPETSVSRVLSVFKIYNPTWRVRKFNLRKADAKDKENVAIRYHGTSLFCDLGDGNKSKLCARVECGLCSILRTGFKLAKAKSGWQRFGPGIYTTQTSGKANDYVKSPFKRRAVLVCKVLAGKVYRTQMDMPGLKRAPDGYDSVSGEVGLHLNYDETVVYQSKAVLPMYMIVYELR